jgi:hypothetical protein
LGRTIHKTEKALPDAPISFVSGGLEMKEDRSMARSPVGIIHKAVDPGLVKYIDPVVGHGLERLVDNGV